MARVRKIKTMYKSSPVIEGAGVHLKRVFGHHQAPQLDPFLLLDDFHSNEPAKYEKGFPWHPHRGIETITYLLEGEVEHGDSMGNKGLISSGDVQWMTAGNGIVHQEMPKGDSKNRLWGFQLWANLPAAHKMMAPRYQEIKADRIPRVELDNGVLIKVICGKINEVEGPVTDIVIEPQYLDVFVPEQTVFTLDTPMGHTVFAYIIDGAARFNPDTSDFTGKQTLVFYEDGDSAGVITADQPVRFLLVSGKPINEPVAWQGPIVMNTDEELATAFQEYQNGTFLKHQKS
jgi:redox-sensitive bicupin YhaK (pirin superfamily)